MGLMGCESHGPVVLSWRLPAVKNTNVQRLEADNILDATHRDFRPIRILLCVRVSLSQ